MVFNIQFGVWMLGWRYARKQELMHIGVPTDLKFL
jgi:hypothetical protein